MDIANSIGSPLAIFVMPFFNLEDKFSTLYQIPIYLNPRGLIELNRKGTLKREKMLLVSEISWITIKLSI